MATPTDTSRFGAAKAPALPAVANFEAVMAGLLLPLADAELTDRELARLEAKASRAAKERAKNAWHLVYMRERAARSLYLAAGYLTSAAVFHPSTDAEKAAAREAEASAWNAWMKTVDAPMRVPAATCENLKWKRDHAHLRVDWRKHLHEKPGPNPEWVALIAADEARLGKHEAATRKR